MSLDLESYTVQISAGQSLSPAIKLGVKVLAGLQFDSAWVSPTGGCTFQSSADGGSTWVEMVDAGAGTAVSVAAGAAKPGQLAALSSLTPWASTNMVRVRSGTAAAPVNQTNTTVITVFVRSVTF